MVFLITTSRYPTKRIRTFTRDLNKAIPGSTRVTRGKKSVKDLGNLCNVYGVNRVLIVGRYKGGPGKINILKMKNHKPVYEPVTLLIKGVTLTREIPQHRREIFNKGIFNKLEIVVLKGEAEKDAEILCEALNVPLKKIETLTEMKSFEDDVVCALTMKGENGSLEIRFIHPSNMKEIGPRIKVKEIIQWKTKRRRK